ncbi:TIR domain-containing protein [Staphylococcus aureus]|uniref:TIR domain-containing protein n=1 Tax=Staphylococcus aureus TaxID=1280 RepID=UPI001F050BC9|nr:TIR domain-containing protein [Staphylococcus aureus]
MERQQTYKEKAQHLYKVKKIKNRYNTKSAEEYFFSIPQVKYILSAGRMKKHKENYNASEIKIKKAALEKSRKNKNWKIEERLIKAKRYTQKVDPEYLNIYMKAYHKKDITTEEKLEILTELKKFDTENIVRFFRKLNDAEQNKTCYCDWTMDQDYLKRKYVGEYTKQVLKARMEQSKMLVLLSTENSVQSDWVSFEIEYFENLKKPIYIVESLEELLEAFSD